MSLIMSPEAAVSMTVARRLSNNVPGGAAGNSLAREGQDK
jgi:hypothetical protein